MNNTPINPYISAHKLEQYNRLHRAINALVLNSLNNNRKLDKVNIALSYC